MALGLTIEAGVAVLCFPQSPGSMVEIGRDVVEQDRTASPPVRGWLAAGHGF